MSFLLWYLIWHAWLLHRGGRLHIFSLIIYALLRTRRIRFAGNVTDFQIYLESILVQSCHCATNLIFFYPVLSSFECMYARSRPRVFGSRYYLSDQRLCQWLFISSLVTWNVSYTTFFTVLMEFLPFCSFTMLDAGAKSYLLTAALNYWEKLFRLERVR